VIANGRGEGSRTEVWDAMTGALGLPAAVAEGDRVATSGPGVPPLAGVVERVAPGMLTVRTEEPAPGIVFLAAEGQDGSVWTSCYAYLFGGAGAAAAPHAERAWRAWMQERFAATPTTGG
jgi:hypothetical protein